MIVKLIVMLVIVKIVQMRLLYVGVTDNLLNTLHTFTTIIGSTSTGREMPKFNLSNLSILSF